MRRRYGHLGFGFAAAVCALVAISQGLRLQHASRVNAAIAAASPRDARAIASHDAPNAASAEAPTVAAPPPVASLPEARLAHAVALSKSDYDGALAAYKAIIQGSRGDLRQIALYDLGNLHLRQALKAGLDDEAQSLPLTELAKQSYRDLLRKDPTDWDARYNLERALRIAPEEDDESGAETGPPDPKEQQRSTIADPRMDLP